MQAHRVDIKWSRGSTWTNFDESEARRIIIASDDDKAVLVCRKSGYCPHCDYNYV